LTEAAKYYKMAADQGDARCQVNYGLCLKNGDGVSKNFNGAAKYYRMAADQGFELAEEALDRVTAILQEKLPSNLIVDVDNLEEVGEVGKGAVGVVRLMENNVTREQCAVKFFDGEFEPDLLFREVSILGLVNHPCILEIWGLPNEVCRQPRVVTEYITNGSVGDALMEVKEGRPPIFWSHDNIAVMIAGIVLGMKYLHSKNILHRDLKPGNLLIDRRNRIRICDFGRAMIENCFRTGRPASSIGSAAYLSPESWEGVKATKKVDVFAFGLIVYEILTGECVFGKDLKEEEIRERKKYRPEIPGSVPIGVAKLIRECWSDYPDRRPTFDKIYEELRILGL
jgi:serine/threonine protein kinase